MLLGKRPRLPIKRTTSMTGIRGDLADDVELEHVPTSDDHPPPPVAHTNSNYSATSLVSPTNLRPTDHFLRTCGLCKRRLAPGRDIYMYRGDTAFCSSECREKQIKEDERKEDWYGSGRKKDERQAAAAAASTAGGRGARKNQTGGR